MTCGIFLPTGAGLYSNKPHYHLLFVVSVFTLCWNTKPASHVFSCIILTIYRRKEKIIWVTVRLHEQQKDQTKWKRTEWNGRGRFGAADTVGWFSGGLPLLRRGRRTGSVAAYVQRVIKVKDLQFSPGPPTASHPFRNYWEWFTRRQNCQPAQTSTTSKKSKLDHPPTIKTVAIDCSTKQRGKKIICYLSYVGNLEDMSISA